MYMSINASLYCFIQEKPEILLCPDERSEGEYKDFVLGVLNLNFSPGF